MTQDILINGPGADVDRSAESMLELEEPEPFTYDEESVNLVKDFMGHEEGEEALEEITRIVIDNFAEGYENTGKYRKRVADDWKLLACELAPKTWPHEHAANAHIPITIENICRIYFRAEEELFGDRDTIFGVVPLGGDDEVADILTKHGNWQLRSQIIDFGRQMSRSLLALFFIGDVTIHSYYSQPLRMNRHEMLTPDEFVTPYVYVSTMPDWSDVPWRAKILQMYPHDLELMKDTWENVDKLLEEREPSHEDEPEMKLGNAAADVLGQKKMESSPGMQRPKKPTVDGSAPHKLICYEGWLDLPNQEKKRFCQVVVDYASETILSLLIHERPNWQDQQRFNTQQQQLMQYRASLAQYKAAQEQRQMMLQQMSMAAEAAAPIMGPQQQQAVSESMLSVPEPEPPLAPEWMTNPDDPEAGPEPVRKEPIHLYAHGVCIEPLVGNLGLGYGRPIADHNRVANVATSQFIDAATMANVWSVVVSDQVEFNGAKTGGLVIAPGSVNKATGMSASDIRESIIELKPQPANPQLMELVQRAREWGQETAQAPEALSGEPGKSGETYRGLAARIEQATKQLANPTRRFANTALERVLINNAYLNSIYMPDEEVFAVQQENTTSWEIMKAGRKLYDRSYNVEIRADLRFISQTQRIQEADAMLAFANSMQEMAGNIAFKWEAARKALLARGRRDMVPLLGPKPPPPTTAFGMPPMPEVPQPTQPGTQVHNPEGDQAKAPPPGVQGPGGQPEGMEAAQ
jgi:hypothetical protein